MADLERMTIVMPPKMAAEIKAAVESGDYTTSSEVIREALRDWRDRRAFAAQRKAAQDERYRAAIDKAMASGPSEPYDMQEILAEARRQFAAERNTLHETHVPLADA